MAETQAPACSLDGKPISSARAVAGLRSSRTVTSVTMPRSPSEPVTTPSRSYPSQSSALPPSRTISPDISTSSTPVMLLVVSPYFRQCTPPEFSATLPPMVQAIWLDGSGA